MELPIFILETSVAKETLARTLTTAVMAELKTAQFNHTLLARIPLSSLSVIQFFSAAIYPKLLWRDMHSGVSYVGTGQQKVWRGDTLDAWNSDLAEIYSLIKADDVIVLGGNAFDMTGGDVSEPWTEYKRYSYFLPECVFIENTKGCFLQFQFKNEHTDLAELEARVHFICDAITVESRPLKEKSAAKFDGYSIDETQWKQVVDTVKKRISEHKYQKLVLSRAAYFDVSNFDIQETVMQMLDTFQTGKMYCFSVNEKTSFVGLSPELLFQISRDVVISEAVAGTRGRGVDAENDDDLAEQLMIAKKETDEHVWVQEMIGDTLGEHCSDVRVGKGEILKMPNVQHRISQITARLKSGGDFRQILKSLHPTPAVAGVPRDAVMDALPKLENFDRGWFAGAMGVLSADVQIMSVNLRCGLFTQNKGIVYTGAGIIKESESDLEWSEINEKMKTVLGLLNLT